MGGLLGYGAIVGVFGFKCGNGFFRLTTLYAFSVIPFFILMGLFLANAKLGSDLFALANAFIGRFRGGMAMATIGTGALFASVCGSSIATASTIATVTVPEMRKYNYSEGFARRRRGGRWHLRDSYPPSAGVTPFWIALMVAISLVIIFPEIALFLPRMT
jgi:TRAP-type C4-dicarboxylate transport system permease large subunit